MWNIQQTTTTWYLNMCLVVVAMASVKECPRYGEGWLYMTERFRLQSTFVHAYGSNSSLVSGAGGRGYTRAGYTGGRG